MDSRGTVLGSGFLVLVAMVLGFMIPLEAAPTDQLSSKLKTPGQGKTHEGSTVVEQSPIVSGDTTTEPSPAEPGTTKTHGGTSGTSGSPIDDFLQSLSKETEGKTATAPPTEIDLYGSGSSSDSKDGGKVKLAHVEVSSIPEPGTLALLGCGLATLGLLWRRKKTA